MTNLSSIDKSKLERSFLDSDAYSEKWSNYFAIYMDLFEKYVGTNFTFVEIGVLHGGSLFMWRNFFGPKARIIGIDLNPEALKWKEFGFEIYIGDQADSNFWQESFITIGNFDVLLDDGGHTNFQQIQTIRNALNFANDGGLIVIEDTQTSYQKDFGNPSKGSTINFAMNLVDHIALRNPELQGVESNQTRRIHSIEFFESIFAIKVDSRKCQNNFLVTNKKAVGRASDFRYQNGSAFENSVRKLITKFGLRFSLGLLKPVNIVFIQVQRSLYLSLKIYLFLQSRNIRIIK